jgi:4-amino-4-deoxy-L-arabinose transferase-like glycosyltransferase
MFKNLDKKIGKSHRIYKGFITFVLGALFILMILILNGSFSGLSSYKDKFSSVDILFCIMSIVTICIVYISHKRGISSKFMLIGIIVLGLVVRVLYAFTIDSIPISDFAVMYDTAERILESDFSMLWGTEYIARFPHITIPTLYYAVIRYVFSDPLLVIKGINVVASTCNIVIIYKITEELFSSRGKAIMASLITALYPPLILYTAVFTTENLAMPFLLLGIYMFILFIKRDKNWKVLVLAALSLSVGNLFRMVGQIILIAFILYIIISYKEKIKNKLISVSILVSVFLIPLIITSFSLQYSGIMEYQLWKGSEPNLTNIVKGLNIENNGRWNLEDGAISKSYNFDYEKIEEECKNIIWDRLTTTPKGELLKFFANKYSSQWSVGDFSGAYWAEHSIEENKSIKFSENGIWFGQLFFVILISLSYIGLLNIKEVKQNRPLSLIYYIFCGYSILYLVSENQARYGFIVCWIFIIMATVGIDLLQKIGTVERNRLWRK